MGKEQGRGRILNPCLFSILIIYGIFTKKRKFYNRLFELLNLGSKL